MSYCDYGFYCDKFHGKMSEADFERFSEPASAFIGRVTFGRITDEALSDEATSDLIKRACCACAERMQSDDASGNGNIAQEVVGAHSKSYRQRSEDEKNRALYESVKLYLGDIYINGVKLMYRGG